jgi:hypothetical protein
MLTVHLAAVLETVTVCDCVRLCTLIVTCIVWS